MVIYSRLSPTEASDSKLLGAKGDIGNNQKLGISSNEFYEISSSTRKKKPFSVRELELELQLGSEVTPERQLRGIRLKMSDHVSSLDRY